MNDDTSTIGDPEDGLDARLAAAGGVDVAPPDEFTVARIERDLRNQHGAPRRPRVLAPVLAGVAAAVVVVALAGIGDNSRPVDTAGTGRDLAPALTTIPQLPPDDGRAGDPDPDDGEAPDPGSDDGTSPDTTGAPDPAPDDADDGAPNDGPATTVPGDRPSDTQPVDTRPTPTDTRPTTTTTRADEPTPTRLRAAVTARGNSAVIAWDDPDVVVTSWSIIRRVEPPEGSLAPAREDVVLKSDDAALRRHADEPPERGTVTYVVRGHRADGAVVTRSARLVLER